MYNSNRRALVAREKLRDTEPIRVSQKTGEGQKEERCGFLPWAQGLNFSLNPSHGLSKAPTAGAKTADSWERQEEKTIHGGQDQRSVDSWGNHEAENKMQEPLGSPRT